MLTEFIKLRIPENSFQNSFISSRRIVQWTSRIKSRLSTVIHCKTQQTEKSGEGDFSLSGNTRLNECMKRMEC